MDGGVSAIYYLAVAASAGGQVYSGYMQSSLEEEREKQLRLERKQAELTVLDEENERLRGLQEANADLVARSGNVDPYASPSLLAIRDYNLRTIGDDIANLYLNAALNQSELGMQLRFSRLRGRVARVGGILGAVQTGMQGSMLGKKTAPPKEGE